MLHCAWDVETRRHEVYDLNGMRVLGVYSDELLQSMWNAHGEEYRDKGVRSMNDMAKMFAGDPFSTFPLPE